MEWNSWVTWTVQGLLWAVLALLFVWMLVRLYFVEKASHYIDKHIADNIFEHSPGTFDKRADDLVRGNN